MKEPSLKQIACHQVLNGARLLSGHITSAMAISYHPTSKCPFMTVPMYKFRVNFRVSIRFRVKLHYIILDSVRLKVLLTRLKVLLTRLTSGVYVHLYVHLY